MRCSLLICSTFVVGCSLPQKYCFISSIKLINVIKLKQTVWIVKLLVVKSVACDWYTLWAIKKRDTFIFSITHTNIDWFRIFFTAVFSDELRNKNFLQFSSHLKSVTALPCESWMFNSEILQHVIQCKCDAELFIYSICLPDMLDSVFYVYTD